MKINKKILSTSLTLIFFFSIFSNLFGLVNVVKADEHNIVIEKWGSYDPTGETGHIQHVYDTRPSELDGNAYELSPGDTQPGILLYDVGTDTGSHPISDLQISVEYVCNENSYGDGPQIFIKNYRQSEEQGKEIFDNSPNPGRKETWSWYTWTPPENPNDYKPYDGDGGSDHLSIKIYAWDDGIPLNFKGDHCHVRKIKVTYTFCNSPPDVPDAPTARENKRYANVGESLTFYAETDDSDGDSVWYRFDWGDGTFSDWVQESSNTGQASVSHSWNRKDIYSVKVQATDYIGLGSYGEVSDWSEATEVKIGSNNVPADPGIYGPNSVKSGSTATFEASSIDTDFDNWRIGWDWNDDTIVDEWTACIGNYDNDVITIDHVFRSQGTYHIKAMAEDEWGGRSYFTPYTVVVSQSKSKPAIYNLFEDFPLFAKLFQFLFEKTFIQ